MTVAILGCGPSGLVAAHAAAEAGHDIRIFSKPRKSQLFGAQYLHEPIPGIDAGESIPISYELRGSIEQYRRKVYGWRYDGSVSPGSLPANHPAYDIRHTYDQLWKRYAPYVSAAVVDPGWLEWNARKYDAVLSSVPLPAICKKASYWHREFKFQGIWAYGDAPEREQFVGDSIPEGTVICNGYPTPRWYRASRIFGYATLEWSWQGLTPPMKVSAVKKPLSNNCDCWPEVARIGRYGKWQKGVLVHEAYEDTRKCLESL